MPGMRGPAIQYDCLQTPPACLSDYTCACIAPNLTAGDCMVGPEGGVTVTLYAP